MNTGGAMSSIDANDIVGNSLGPGAVIGNRGAMVRAATRDEPPRAKESEGKHEAETGGLCVHACVILAGGLKPSPLAAAVGMSVLNLPLRPGQSVLQHWIEHLCALCHSEDAAEPGVPTGPGPEPATRLVVPVDDAARSQTDNGATTGGSAPAPGLRAAPELVLAYTANTPGPVAPERHGPLRFRRVVTPAGLRGPAGSVYDICVDLPSEAHVLVLEGNRYLTRGLDAFLRCHRENGADVTVACNPDRTPAGMYLLRRRTLDLVQDRGFVDLKEQWLKKVAQNNFGVRIHHLGAGQAFPLRSWRQFRGAARVAQGLPFAVRFLSEPDRLNNSGHAGPVDVLRIVSDSAVVADDAIVADSIVLDDARVDAGAVVVRSLIGPGAVVARGRRVVDQIVTRDGTIDDPDPLHLGRKRQGLGATRRLSWY